MAATAKNPRPGKSAAILFAGLIAGALLRYQESGATRTDRGGTTESDKERDSPETVAASNPAGPTKLKDRGLPAGMISFSPQQWSQVVSDPATWRISVSDCKQGQVATFNDLPVVSRLFQAAESGSSLEHYTAFFGWDEPRSKKIREMLSQFGGAMGRVQDEVANISYPGEGKVRIDYSAGNERFRNLTTELEKNLVDLVGAKDAGRFMLLSSIPSWGDQSRELSVSRSPDGKTLDVNGLNTGFTIEGGPDAIGRLNTFMRLEKGMAPEGIDWQQLAKEAGFQAPPSR